MNIANILARKGSMAVTVQPEQSIREALALLERHNIGALVAVQGDRPVGILSERDIVREAARNESFFARTVGDLMTRDVITGQPPDDLLTVAYTMTERRIRHLPVVDQGRLIGMVSIGDVLKAQRDHYQGEVDTLQTQLLTGTPARPLRVAIVGAGPTGFYAADHLLRNPAVVVDVDMFDRLPTPYGLVRLGVAPDHQKIKFVTNAFDKVAASPRFRFYGGVEFGKDVTLADLKALYHQIVYCTGAQTDRRMGIPGEDLTGSHPATEFVAWYNGHPDYRDCAFDLSQESVAVVGVGNVAADVVRILCRTPEELATTDIADYALEALRKSRVREVYLLGRRGPAQAAFTNPEVRELGELADADITAIPQEVELDPLSRVAVERSQDRATLKKVEMLREYARRAPTGKSRRLVLRFLVSPVELISDGAGRVAAMRLVRNELYATSTGALQPRATDDTKLPIVGEYAAGWIKRGPTGVIGTNKPDAAETVECMFEDLARGAVLEPTRPEAAAAEALVRQRQPNYVSYTDWLKLNEIEVARGRAQGRPRVKLTSVEEMLAALGR